MPATPRQPRNSDILLFENRLAFTPREFAKFFGKSGTWGYRRIYDGTVKPIRGLGSLMIPKSEMDRLLADAAIYVGRRPDRDFASRHELKVPTEGNKAPLRRTRSKQTSKEKPNQQDT